MKIKDNMANIVSVSRIFVAYIAIGLLFVKSTYAYSWAVILTAVAFAMDGLDGYIARKYNQSSEWGSVLDIMGDRIVEASYWIVFAVLGWLNILFPIICIARALAVKPKLLILDEALSSLDMIIQAEIIHLLDDLKKQYNLSYLVISHDIRIILKLCDDIMFLENGKIKGIHSIENGINKDDEVFNNMLLV